MKILVVNGRKVSLTQHELLQMMQHKFFVGYFLSILLLVMALKPFSGFYQMNVMTTTLIFTPGCIVYLTVYFGGLLLQEKIGLRPTTIILWPIAAFSTATTVVILGQWLDLGEVTAIDLTTLYLFHLIVFFLGELAFVSFIMEPCLADIRKDRAPPAMQHPDAPAPPALATPPVTAPVVAPVSPLPAPPPPAFESSAQDVLSLFGERFDKAELWAIRAVEHYVEIKTKAGDYRLLRGRMSEAEKSLPPELGLRVHRSHWVSAQALKTLEQGRDRWQLSLHCGTEVPVARARREETKQWASRVLGPQS
jgi:hypothetical protein